MNSFQALWIDIKDARPPKEDHYLTANTFFGVSVARFTPDFDGVWTAPNVSGDFTEYVTHWMPIYPPEGVNKYGR